MTIKDRIAMMRAAAANQGYLKYASGYPLTLTKTLAKPPESVTVYGNTGGVGDWDTETNMFGRMNAQPRSTDAIINEYTDTSLIFTSTEDGARAVDLTYPIMEGQSYTLNGKRTGCNLALFYNSAITDNRIAYNPTMPYTFTAEKSGNLVIRYITGSASEAGRTATVTNAAFYGCYKIPILLQGRNLFSGWEWGTRIDPNTGEETKNAGNYASSGFIPVDTSSRISASGLYKTVTTVFFGYDEDFNFVARTGGRYVNFVNLRAVDFSSTVQSQNTIKFIRICEQSGLTKQMVDEQTVMMLNAGYSESTMPEYEPYINKTINLYSDAALGANDSLTVNPKAKTAARGATDISALQDFEQDWKIPKAEELTVTAGTTVEPEKLDMAYLSKDKAWRIYGASGGVGDKTANLFDGEIESGGINPNTGKNLPAANRTRSKQYIAVKPGTAYTIQRSNTAGYLWVLGYDSNFNAITDGTKDSNYPIALITGSIGSKTFSFTTTKTTRYSRWYYTNSTDLSETIMIVEGSYTTATMPEYEPYGYKIPVQMTTAEDTTTVNIYSDAALDDGDVLTVTPKKLAMRNDTDVSDMQDWEQDWKVPKGVTGVTVDTTVQPSKFEV